MACYIVNVLITNFNNNSSIETNKLSLMDANLLCRTIVKRRHFMRVSHPFKNKFIFVKTTYYFLFVFS